MHLTLNYLKTWNTCLPCNALGSHPTSNWFVDLIEFSSNTLIKPIARWYTIYQYTNVRSTTSKYNIFRHGRSIVQHSVQIGFAVITDTSIPVCIWRIYTYIIFFLFWFWSIHLVMESMNQIRAAFAIQQISIIYLFLFLFSFSFTWPMVAQTFKVSKQI